VRLLALCTFLAAMALVPAAGAVSANAPATVTARRSDYGRILFDGRACSGPCAAAWPPYVVGARAHAGRGVDGSLLGTTRRRGGGLQVTYDGKPLYYYVGDRKPLQVLCQDVVEFGGRWLVVRPDGRTVR
jgi:predicted lipoprotein with Yx(FWY)xxD motif